MTAGVVAVQFVVVLVKVKVALPAATPVTTPAFVTVAIVLSLLTQVPPVAGDKVIVEPTQTLELLALTAGKALIVTAEVVAVHPVILSVKVKVGLPAATAVTTPVVGSTVAKAILLLTHVPPVVGDKVVDPPTQIELLPVMPTAGEASTVTAAVVAEHPVAVLVNVKVGLPAETPVTTPAFVTVA